MGLWSGLRGEMAALSVQLSLNESLAAVPIQPSLLSQKDYRSVTHTHSGAPHTSPQDIISEGDRGIAYRVVGENSATIELDPV